MNTLSVPIMFYSPVYFDLMNTYHSELFKESPEGIRQFEREMYLQMQTQKQ